jgi:hypothetical protein
MAAANRPPATSTWRCKMLHACELTSDVGRAEDWLALADRYVARTNRVPISAICRTHDGGVLTAAGRWDDAERELVTSIRLYDQTYRALRGAAVVRLAALRCARAVSRRRRSSSSAPSTTGTRSARRSSCTWRGRGRPGRGQDRALPPGPPRIRAHRSPAAPAGPRPAGSVRAPRPAPRGGQGPPGPGRGAGGHATVDGPGRGPGRARTLPGLGATRDADAASSRSACAATPDRGAPAS